VAEGFPSISIISDAMVGLQCLFISNIFLVVERIVVFHSKVSESVLRVTWGLQADLQSKFTGGIAGDASKNREEFLHSRSKYEVVPERYPVSLENLARCRGIA
jgi:hypothetical protein